MSHRVVGLCAVALLVTLLTGSAAIAAGPANVKIRVEGQSKTLVPLTSLTTTTARVPSRDGNPAHDCSGTSALGALQQSTGGDWNGTFFDGSGYFVDTIRGEAHRFPDPAYFSLWINNRSSSVGSCSLELQEGDEVLYFVDRCDNPDPVTFACQNAPVTPLGFRGLPARVDRNVAFTVEVVRYAADGTATPAAGATVTAGPKSAPTDAAGRATLTLEDAGPVEVRADKAGSARTAGFSVCASNGSDGACGTVRAQDPAPPAGPAAATAVVTPACETSGEDGRCGTRDREDPRARISQITNGERFARGRAPRELKGTVDADPSGLRTVKLRLTRRYRGRCQYLSGGKDRLVDARCGRSFRFSIGDRADWSYLLPGALPPGRYVLDVIAIDNALNRDDRLQRGRNRVVFTVGRT